MLNRTKKDFNGKQRKVRIETFAAKQKRKKAKRKSKKKNGKMYR